MNGSKIFSAPDFCKDNDTMMANPLCQGNFMERMFGLIKNQQEIAEKRTLPKFNFCYMTFRCRCPDGNELTFEVSDISYSGMQLATRDGNHRLGKGDKIKGELHVTGQRLPIEGQIAWATGPRAGVRFVLHNDDRGLRQLLGPDSFSHRLRPIHEFHDSDLMAHIPVGLKFWLHADGPVEIFFWQHPDGEWRCIQAIYMENFVEWLDGRGVITGRTMSKRDLDTPLIHEDEFVFGIDPELSSDRIHKVVALIEALSDRAIPNAAKEFFLRKLHS